MGLRQKSQKSLPGGRRTRGSLKSSCNVPPRYVRVVDPFEAGRLMKVLDELDDAFSPEQLAVYERWKSYQKERAEEAKVRAIENKKRREQQPKDPEVEQDACRRKKIETWD